MDKTIQALRCHRHGTPDQLQLDTIPSLVPRGNEVVVTVVAIGVAFTDVLMVANKYQLKPPLPFAPGSEVTGIIKQLGNNTPKNLKIGQRVLVPCGYNGFAEEVKVHHSQVVVLPNEIDFATPLCLGYNYGTVLHALKDRANLQPGETILVLGASGGVGCGCVELAKAMGATVIAAAASDDKLELCRQIGADYTINYTKPLRKAIKDIVGGKGVDVVFDTVGGDYCDPALRSMGFGGRYLVIGFAAGTIPKPALNLCLLKSCSIVGVFWGLFAQRFPQQAANNRDLLIDWVVQGKIKPYISRKFMLENGVEALVEIVGRKVVGKVVLVTEAAKLYAPELVADGTSLLSTSRL